MSTVLKYGRLFTRVLKLHEGTGYARKGLRVTWHMGTKGRAPTGLVAKKFAPPNKGQISFKDWEEGKQCRLAVKKWVKDEAEDMAADALMALLLLMSALVAEAMKAEEEDKKGLKELKDEREKLEKEVAAAEEEKLAKEEALKQIEKEYNECYVDWGGRKKAAIDALNQDLAQIRSELKEHLKNIDLKDKRITEVEEVLDSLQNAKEMSLMID